MHWEKSWLKYYMAGIFSAFLIIAAYKHWKPRKDEQG